MVKLSNKSINGTHFQGVTINTTFKELTSKVGNPQHEYNCGEDKSNFNWTCETEDGTVFTIYDWKEYRPLKEDEVVEFHIGSHSKENSLKAFNELKKLEI